MHKLATVVFFAVVTWAAYAAAQTCIISAPSAPPQAKVLIVYLPGDGGTTGCTISASAPGSTGAPQSYPIGNAKCATSVNIANQAIANDNGWNDGGVP